MVAFSSLVLALPLLGAVFAVPVAQPVAVAPVVAARFDLGDILTGGFDLSGIFDNIDLGTLLTILNTTLGGKLPTIDPALEKEIGTILGGILGNLGGSGFSEKADFGLGDIKLGDLPALGGLDPSKLGLPDWLTSLLEFLIKIFGQGGAGLPSLPIPLPTDLPTSFPIPFPTDLPTGLPSLPIPTELPTAIPTELPIPTDVPSIPIPTELPTALPIPTELPTGLPIPTELPTELPEPTLLPTGPDEPIPTGLPTDLPGPTLVPTDTTAPIPTDTPEEPLPTGTDAAPIPVPTEISIPSGTPF